MGKFIHKILYRTLPLEGYLRAVSRLFFLWQRLGIGREAPATEYVYHLPKLVRARETGYFGTGQNFVNDAGGRADVEFTAQMRRGSELFGKLERLDFIKCDIEGYEVIVMREMRPLLERHRPTVLIETGGENRPQIVALFTGLGYTGYTLDRGREIPLTDDSSKDIIFRPGN